ncbi:MAG: succinate dehydrogenase, hydrophobic membrane anchor protein [Rhodospirillaceae bacterium]
MTMRSHLGRVRGLGSAKEGAGSHWMAERITAIALIPLSLWFVFFAVIPNLDVSYADYVAWMGSPLNASLMLLFILCSFHHGMLGLIVIIEDYVHAPVAKHVLVFGTKFFAAFGAMLAVVSVLKLTFGG